MVSKNTDAVGKTLISKESNSKSYLLGILNKILLWVYIFLGNECNGGQAEEVIKNGRSELRDKKQRLYLEDKDSFSGDDILDPDFDPQDEIKDASFFKDADFVTEIEEDYNE